MRAGSVLPFIMMYVSTYINKKSRTSIRLLVCLFFLSNKALI